LLHHWRWPRLRLRASSVQVNSVWDFIVKGGPLMIPIGLCSLVGLAIIVERMVSLRRKQIIPPGFLPGLRNLLKSGREDRSAAIEYCRTNASPVANIFLAGLKHMHEPVERMEKFIQEAGEREVQRLRKNLRSLSVIG
jgi:biopolymer transport protein ExbB